MVEGPRRQEVVHARFYRIRGWRVCPCKGSRKAVRLFSRLRWSGSQKRPVPAVALCSNNDLLPDDTNGIRGPFAYQLTRLCFNWFKAASGLSCGTLMSGQGLRKGAGSPRNNRTKTTDAETLLRWTTLYASATEVLYEIDLLLPGVVAKTCQVGQLRTTAGYL